MLELRALIASFACARLGPLCAQRERWLLSLILAFLGLLPLLVTSGLPLQDLPNHWAAMSIAEHIDRYPEFESTGLLKTNALFFAFIRVLHAAAGISWVQASKWFVACVVVQNAYTLPRALSVFGGRAALRTSGPFLLPLVHNWWILMGMLDFAASLPLALEAMIALQAMRVRPSAMKRLRVVLISLLVWYAHVFSVLLLLMLWVLEACARRVGSASPMRSLRSGWIRLGATSLLLAPVAALAFGSLTAHLFESTHGIRMHYAPFLAPWDNAYNIWAECCAGLTRHSACSLVGFLPFALGLRRVRARVPWFSAASLAVLAACAMFGPYILTAWFYVNSRVFPLLWMAILARARMPTHTWLRRLIAPLGYACALAFSATLSFDYRVLGAEQALVLEAVDALPAHARVLPLVLDAKGSGEHTRPLVQAWGHYVVDKQVSAPLLFSHSRSFPVAYRVTPAPGQSALELENETRLLSMHHCLPDDADCEARTAAQWRRFWEVTAQPYDYVVVIGAKPPRGFESEFVCTFRGKLTAVYTRIGVQPEQP